MQYFARIVFYLDNDYSFYNLSTGAVLLFTDGDATCVAQEDDRFSRHRIILKYGPFSTKEEAEIKGTNLVRRIKLEMLNRECPISISDSTGALDNPVIDSIFGGISEWEKLCNGFQMQHGGKIIENEHIGLGIYEVNNDLSEILFASGEALLQTKQKLTLTNEPLDYWDNYMDISLSLLVSSIAINDSRVKFLLRMMAIEALASKPQFKDSDYLAAIEELKNQVDQIDTCEKNKELIKSQLGMFKEKSVSQRVRELLIEYLPDRQFDGQTAEKLFAQCYRARSSFVHTGSLPNITGEIIRSLKLLCTDLLFSISKNHNLSQK